MIINGNALHVPLADGTVQTCVTSPPYYGLRDYGVGEQIGLEETPEEYIANMVAVFREVRRVLRDDGTIWVNMGDSYNGNKSGNTETNKNPRVVSDSFEKKLWDGAKVKDLLGIPWMLAFALRADGWYLRSDIIWAKPNPMPESVRDRPTKAHEYIFLLSKQARYYYDADAIREPLQTREPGMVDPGNNIQKRQKQIEHDKKRGSGGHFDGHKWNMNSGGRNKRSVWEVTTKPYSGAHFATFPPDLIEPCILAGSREGDVVLDPFSGSGTTGQVAIQHRRKYFGIELNMEYIALSRERTTTDVMLPMMAAAR